MQQPTARKVSAIFVDAATRLPVTATLEVTVRTAAGALASVARDQDGNVQNRFTVTNGIAMFQVDRAAALPVTLNVVATANGYDPAAATVTLTADGEYETVARMVNRARPPAYATVAARPVGTADANGVTQIETVVTTAATLGGAPSVSLTVPAATTLRDADGQPLSGALVARLSYYDVSNDSALAMLPGGGDAVVPASGGATEQVGRFVSAGFASVEITDASGRQAATSSSPLPITINLGSTVRTPITGAVLTAGSTIPFWSYTATLGRWAAEPAANVTRDAADRLQAVSQPAHLTLFNAGWLETRECAAPARVVVNGNAANARLTTKLSLDGGGFARTYEPGANLNEFTLANAIPGRPSRLSVRLDGAEVGSVSVADACAGGQVVVPVNVPATIRTGAMAVEVLHCCIEDANQCVSVRNNGTVVLSPQTAEDALPIVRSTDDAGKALFEHLRAGASYQVNAAVFGQSQGAVVTRVVEENRTTTVRIQLPSFRCEATGASGGSSS